MKKRNTKPMPIKEYKKKLFNALPSFLKIKLITNKPKND
jgi:hypothetical protein